MSLTSKIKPYFVSNKVLVPTVEESISNFQNAPDKCFFDIQKREFCWLTKGTLFESVVTLDNIHVISKGLTLGYVEGISINAESSTAAIDHFATHENFTRRKIGSAIARVLAAQLKARYSIRSIVFREVKYKNPAYAHFFKSLGATAHYEKNLIYSSWIFNFDGLDLTPEEILMSLPY